MSRALTVLATGPQALVQDLGRPGNAHLGVPPSGALDRPALTLANRLVGNPEDAAGIEVLLGGLRVRAEASCTVAVTGPPVAVTVGGRPADSHRPVHLRAGDELELGVPAVGLRTYVAVSGGIAVEAELGSRATDVLSGIGPAPLAEGVVLPLGVPSGVPSGEDAVVPTQVPPDLAGAADARPPRRLVRRRGARSSSAAGGRCRRRATGSGCDWTGPSCGVRSTRSCQRRHDHRRRAGTCRAACR